MNKLNKDFYRQNSQNFSKSRNYYWNVFKRTTPYLFEGMSLLDVGCGNGRYAKFISENLNSFEYVGIDFSEHLLNDAKNIKRPGQGQTRLTFQMFDLINEDLSKLEPNQFDLIVVFGLTHHIPSLAKRTKLIKDLKELMHGRSKLIVSYWQFARLEKYISKYVPFEKINILKSEIEENDFLLSWGKDEELIRYTHFTDDVEEKVIRERAGLSLVDSFLDDGKTQKLNKYCIYECITQK